MQVLLDQFSLLKSFGPGSSPNKGYRALQRCAHLLKNGLVHDIILSDALCMLDLFRDWSCIGNSGSLFRRVQICNFTGDTSSLSDFVESDQLSESSNIGVADGTRLGKIRGESLRCLYFLIRSRSEDLIGQWCSLVSDSSGRQGLCMIATMDVDMHARRFALYSVISLFRSETSRRLMARVGSSDNKQGSTSSVSADISNALPVIFNMVQTFLKSTNHDDISSISVVISDFVRAVAHKCRLSVLTEILQLIINQLVHQDLASEIACRFMSAVAIILDLKNPLTCEYSIVLQQQLISICRENNAMILETNCVVSKIPRDFLNHNLMHDIIMNGLRQISLETKAETIEAVFLNVAQLTDRTVEESRIINDSVTSLFLTQQSVEQRDALLTGLGKLSRHSFTAIETIFTIDCFASLVEETEPTVKRIQALGDLLFSAMLANISASVTARMQSRLLQWAAEPKCHQSAALRAIMTGLVRFGEQNTNNAFILGFIGQLQETLLTIWSSEVRSDKTLADSQRTIGLLYVLNAHFSDRFATACDVELNKALVSGKTQQVLSAVYSLSQQNPRDSHWVDQVSNLVAEVCTSLTKRPVWEMGPVVGSMHILHQVALYLHVSQNTLPPLVRLHFHSLVNDERCLLLEAKHIEIAKHLHAIREMLN